MNRLRIYEIQEDYIDFLRTKEPRVYENKNSKSRKYVGPLFEEKGVKFFAPLSSPKESDFGSNGKRANTLSIIRMTYGEDIIGSIRLSHMIPVLDEAIIEYDALDESDVSYQALIFKQIKFINEKNDRIIKNALVLKKQKDNQKKYFPDGTPGYLKNSFDFKSLLGDSGRFTAYKNDLAHQAVLDFAAQSKEFNKGNRFEDDLYKKPTALADLEKNNKSINEIIQEEFVREQQKLKNQGFNSDTMVGFDYGDDDYYIAKKAREEKYEREKKKREEENKFDIFNKEEPIEELEETPKVEETPTIEEYEEEKQEVENIEVKEEVEEKDDLFPNITKATLASKMVSTKALANAIKNIRFKGIKTTSIAGNIFKKDEVLYEMVDYSPIANVALLKNLDQKKVILVYDFPRKNNIDWSEERNFGIDMWRALVEFNKLNS